MYIHTCIHDFIRMKTYTIHTYYNILYAILHVHIHVYTVLIRYD